MKIVSLSLPSRSGYLEHHLANLSTMQKRSLHKERTKKETRYHNFSLRVDSGKGVACPNRPRIDDRYNAEKQETLEYEILSRVKQSLPHYRQLRETRIYPLQITIRYYLRRYYNCFLPYMDLFTRRHRDIVLFCVFIFCAVDFYIYHLFLFLFCPFLSFFFFSFINTLYEFDATRTYACVISRACERCDNKQSAATVSSSSASRSLTITATITVPSAIAKLTQREETRRTE